jgi:hypothetical protein
LTVEAAMALPSYTHTQAVVGGSVLIVLCLLVLVGLLRMWR